MNIRKMILEDLDAVAKLWLASNTEVHGFVGKEYWESHMEDVRKGLLSAKVYVAEALMENGSAGELKILGFIGLSGDYVEGIFVDAAFRSKGVGQELLSFVKERKHHLSLRVYRKNHRALQFYKKEQFLIREMGVDEATGEGEFMMEWERNEAATREAEERLPLHRLTKHVYFTENDATKDRPVLGYIGGSSFAVMVDAGASENHARSYENALKREGLKLPGHCVISHWHWDHTYGIHSLSIPVTAHENTQKELKKMMGWQWSDEAMAERLVTGEEIPFVDEHIRKEYPDWAQIKVSVADYTFSEGLAFDCGGVTCNVLHLPSAHSEDSLVVFIPEERIVFGADIYCEDYYNGLYRDPEKTRGLYEALKALDFDVFVSGHLMPETREDVLEFLKKELEK